MLYIVSRLLQQVLQQLPFCFFCKRTSLKLYEADYVRRKKTEVANMIANVETGRMTCRQFVTCLPRSATSHRHKLLMQSLACCRRPSPL